MDLLREVTQMHNDIVRMPANCARITAPGDAREVFNEMLTLAKSRFPDVLAIRSIEPMAPDTRFLDLAARLQTLKDALATTGLTQ